MARRPFPTLLLASALAASACNAVLGIEEAALDPELSHDAGPGGVGGGGTALRPDEGSACTDPGTLVCGRSSAGSDRAALFCDQGTFTKVFECPGVEDCFAGEKDTFIACGTSTVNLPFAKTGGACPAAAALACAFDDTILLECTGGFWEEARHCAPTHCASTTGPSGARTLACENGGYAVGDRCAFSNGKVVCSVDLTATLACASGKTVVQTTCPAGTRCTDLGSSIGCQ